MLDERDQAGGHEPACPHGRAAARHLGDLHDAAGGRHLDPAPGAGRDDLERLDPLPGVDHGLDSIALHVIAMVALQALDRYFGATRHSNSMPRTAQSGAYGRVMSTRYGHSNVSGGNQDQGERKDDGWESRQGGGQSREPGRSGEPRPGEPPGHDRQSLPPPGTNTQGELAGIREASAESLRELRPRWREGEPAEEDRDDEASGRAEPSGHPTGTDQPPRMGGPLGSDRNDPHLPEGAQSNDDKGSGAGGFDRGVDATNIGAVHQGAREEDAPEAR
jgi:hypothetical protein